MHMKLLKTPATATALGVTRKNDADLYQDTIYINQWSWHFSTVNFSEWLENKEITAWLPCANEEKQIVTQRDAEGNEIGNLHFLFSLPSSSSIPRGSLLKTSSNIKWD